MSGYKEEEIRSRSAHNRYLELVRADAERLASDVAAFEAVACPACGGEESESSFVKAGFTYVECAGCHTLFVSPRPGIQHLAELYAESPSTKFWVDEFFAPMAGARREKIFRPRAEFIAGRFPSLSRARVGDIGAGFGLFLLELRRLWPAAELMAIEPSVDMAARLRAGGIPVIQAMLEDVRIDEPFDLLTVFELFEHLHDPLAFLLSARALLKPGGYLYLTTLNGEGFDIQLHWERSKAVSPPHHLNFVNPDSMEALLARAGYDSITVDTPGQLDWDIVEGALIHEGTDPGRFFRTVARRANAATKDELQSWIRSSGFSSHLRAIARRPV